MRRLLVTHLPKNPEDVMGEVRESYPSAEMIEEGQSYEV